MKPSHIERLVTYTIWRLSTSPKWQPAIHSRNSTAMPISRCGGWTTCQDHIFQLTPPSLQLNFVIRQMHSNRLLQRTTTIRFHMKTEMPSKPFSALKIAYTMRKSKLISSTVILPNYYLQLDSVSPVRKTTSSAFLRNNKNSGLKALVYS